MFEKSDVIVIGGGLIGTTTAWELAQSGMAVTLVDEREGLALDTSFANGGMLTPSMSDPWNGPGVASHLFKSFFNPYSAMKLRLKAIPSLIGWGLRFLANSSSSKHLKATTANFALANYSVSETATLIHDLNLECDYAANGALKIFTDEGAMAGPLSLASALKPYGISYEVLTQEQVVEQEPALEGSIDRIACGISYPSDKVTDAFKFTTQLGERAKNFGVTEIIGEKVIRIRTKGSHVQGIETNKRFVQAPRVVVAAGNSTPYLLKGLSNMIPVKPAKGYSVTIPAAEGGTLPMCPIIDDTMHAAIVPLGKRIRLAGTAEFVGLDRRLSAERVDNLFKMFQTIFPELAASCDRSQAKPWTAFRPMSADGCPVIGATDVEGLYVNTGHGHLGLTMAVGSAKLLTSKMIGSEPAIDPTPYDFRK